MADTSPLAGLLDRAEYVSSLVRELASVLADALLDRTARCSSERFQWGRHERTFERFCDELESLEEAITDPPDGFEDVAEQLWHAARAAQEITAEMLRLDGLAKDEWTYALLGVAEDLPQAIREAQQARKAARFAFLNPEMPSGGEKEERHKTEPQSADTLNRVEEPQSGHRELREFVPLVEHPRPYQPNPVPTGGNPYLTLRHVLRELFWLGALARQGQDVRHHINPTTDPWEAAEARARGSSAGWGIPFTTFDPILTDAKRTMRELVQVAAGNTSVPFSALDPRYTSLTERLQELANSAPADNFQTPIPVGAVHSIPTAGAAAHKEPAPPLPEPDTGPPVGPRSTTTDAGEKQKPEPDTGVNGHDESEPTPADAERVVLAFLAERFRTGYSVVSWSLVEGALHAANFPVVAQPGLIRRTFAALHLAGAVEPIHKPPRHNPYPFVIFENANEPNEWRILPKAVELETERRKGQPQTETRGAALEDLPERARLAFLQHRQAVRALTEEDGRSEADVTDDAAHQYLKDKEMDPPTLETWTRYLREARNALGQQKKKRRPKYDGGSAVPPEHFGDRNDD